MDKVVPRLQVLARSSPLDKHMLVSWLKEKVFYRVLEKKITKYFIYFDLILIILNRER